MKIGQDTDYTKQVGMTLAEIAYSEPQNIQAQLSYPGYATGGNWSLEWLGVSPGNQMYVCKVPNLDQWCIVIRGSDTDPYSEAFWIDWFMEDPDVLFQYPLPFNNGGNNPLISGGALQGFNDLLGMTDVRSGQTLVQYLQDHAIIDMDSIVVIGHSLGGCLASVLAPYLYEILAAPANKPANCILPVTFAAPTAGDINFANYVDGLFDNCPWRCMNALDIVPHSWSLEGLNWILNTYQNGPQIPDLIWGLVDTMYGMLYEGNYNYTQPGPGNIDSAGIYGSSWWFIEAGHQHSGETYLMMYHAPAVCFPLPPKAYHVGLLPRRQKMMAQKAVVSSGTMDDIDFARILNG